MGSFLRLESEEGISVRRVMLALLFAAAALARVLRGFKRKDSAVEVDDSSRVRNKHRVHKTDGLLLAEHRKWRLYARSRGFELQFIVNCEKGWERERSERIALPVKL